MQMLLGAVQSGYNLQRSVRLRSSASAYLNRTPASAGNRKTWTWSGWVKRGTLGSEAVLFSAGATSNDLTFILFSSADKIDVLNNISGTTVLRKVTTAVYRDASAWYHLVVSVDTTNATASNRVSIYVNGTQITAFSTSVDPSLNQDTQVDSTNIHTLGRLSSSATSYFDGYMTEVNFIDGQALTPASFGSTNALTGVWQPAPYTGTYGTNGFYLKFTDNSTAAALGTDFSGNSNTWTVNNISVTAGVTYDSMTDVPTLTSATAANFAVLNPLDKDSAISVLNGNMDVSTTSASLGQVRSSFGMSSGKWYWEFTCGSSGNQDLAGIVKPNATITNYVGADANGWGYYGNNGQKYNNGSGAAYGASYTLNDVIGVAFDADAGTLVFYKNNTSQGTAFSGLTSGPYFAAHSDGSAGATTYAYYNFGQRPFTYTPPTGFVALNTFNLAASTIVKGNTVMDATIWSGDGTSPKAQTNAAGFQPDLVWIKNRSVAYSHNLFDSVRGSGTARSLQSDNTNSEATNASNTALYGYLSAFNSNGFSTTNGTDPTSSSIWVNASGQNYVGWQWKAGGAAVTNTSGSISAQVSANPTAGFSVVTYTGTGANATVGHGLGVAPKMIIVKQRNGTFTWRVYHASLANTQVLFLSATDAATTETTAWNSTTPASSVFSVGTSNGTNGSTNTYVAYCWSEIDGFSKFGSYTGNGSTDGVFVYLGFKPKFVLIKSTSLAQNWTIYDTSRSLYNAADLLLFPMSSTAEILDTGQSIDLVSNGFKIRNSNANENTNGATYIYMAFAENPFKNALAR